VIFGITYALDSASYISHLKSIADDTTIPATEAKREPTRIWREALWGNKYITII
jgi:hypothetical protein